MYRGVIVLSLCDKLAFSAFVAKLTLLPFVAVAFVARLTPSAFVAVAFAASLTFFSLYDRSLCGSFPLEWTLFIRIICVCHVVTKVILYFIWYIKKILLDEMTNNYILNWWSFVIILWYLLMVSMNQYG